MKKWIEILNESRVITDIQNVEFELSTNESHDEYWIFLSIAKHTGENVVNGQIGIRLNGAIIGYYMFAKDYAKSNLEANVHVYMEPINILEKIESTVSPETNASQMFRSGWITKENGTGKLVLMFPGKYTGNIKVRVCAK